MTQLFNSPGPLRRSGTSLLRDQGNGLTERIGTANGGTFGNDHDTAHCNARLLAASYNAFDSAATRLNLNAVELAERMQDGGIADLVSNLKDAERFMRGFEGDEMQEGIDSMLADIRAGIAKVEGRA